MPTGETPRLLTKVTQAICSSSDPDAGLPSLADMKDTFTQTSRRRQDKPDITWSQIIGIPLPQLTLDDRRHAFAVALRQRIHPFEFKHRRHADLFPDSSQDTDVIRRTATVLDGIGASAKKLEMLALPFGITAGALRDNRVDTRTLAGLFEDIECFAGVPGETQRACMRIGRGIEDYLLVSPEHSDGDTILQRAIGAYYRTRSLAVTSGERMSKPRN